MANNPNRKRARLDYLPNYSSVERKGRVVQTVTVASKLSSTPELGSPSGGPGTVNAGNVATGGSQYKNAITP